MPHLKKLVKDSFYKLEEMDKVKVLKNQYKKLLIKDILIEIRKTPQLKIEEITGTLLDNKLESIKNNLINDIPQHTLNDIKEITYNQLYKRGMCKSSMDKVWDMYNSLILKETYVLKELYTSYNFNTYENLVSDSLSKLFSVDYIYTLEGVKFNSDGIKNILFEQFYKNQNRVELDWDNYTSNWLIPIKYNLKPSDKLKIVEEVIKELLPLQVDNVFVINSIIDLFWNEVTIKLNQHIEYILKEFQIFIGKLHLKNILNEVNKNKQVGESISINSNIFLTRRFSGIILHKYINHLNNTRPIINTLEVINNNFYTQLIKEFTSVLFVSYLKVIYNIHTNKTKLICKKESNKIEHDLIYKDLSGVKVGIDEFHYLYITRIGVYLVLNTKDYVSEVFIEKEQGLIVPSDINSLSIDTKYKEIILKELDYLMALDN